MTATPYFPSSKTVRKKAVRRLQKRKKRGKNSIPPWLAKQLRGEW